MALYVDGFVIPLPKKNLNAYRRMAQKAGKVWRDHGALEFRECVGDDLNIKMGKPFPRGIKTKPGETVLFSYIVFKSRTDRDRGQCQGHERSALGEDDEFEGNAVRRETDDVRRVQDDRRSLTLGTERDKAWRHKGNLQPRRQPASIRRWQMARSATSKFQLSTSSGQPIFTKRFSAGKSDSATTAARLLTTRWAKSAAHGYSAGSQ